MTDYGQKGVELIKAFTKVLVKVGTTEKVVLKVPVKELAYYDVTTKKWTVELGKYTFKIGNSSRDLKKEIVVTIQ